MRVWVCEYACARVCAHNNATGLAVKPDALRQAVWRTPSYLLWVLRAALPGPVPWAMHKPAEQLTISCWLPEACFCSAIKIMAWKVLHSSPRSLLAQFLNRFFFPARFKFPILHYSRFFSYSTYFKKDKRKRERKYMKAFVFPPVLVWFERLTNSRHALLK